VTRVVLIGLAGALGTLVRYFVSVWAGRALGAAFPFGTLLVNLAGCFLIAAVSQVAVSTSLVSPTLRLTLTTGFLGGLTTYSAFNFETTQLFRDRAWYAAWFNFGVTTVGCFLAGLLGLLLARRAFGGP
jgi:fluoride exporter